MLKFLGDSAKRHKVALSNSFNKADLCSFIFYGARCCAEHTVTSRNSFKNTAEKYSVSPKRVIFHLFAS